MDAARRRLMLCAALQYTLPGNPCVYYGDEAGMQGAKDPFNRACYPWGAQDEALLAYYRSLGALRKEHRASFSGGNFRLISACLGCIAYERRSDCERLVVIANANPHSILYDLPQEFRNAVCLLGGRMLGTEAEVPAEAAAILIVKNDRMI